MSVSASSISSDTADAPKPKVFLVEDNDDTRVLLAFLLRQGGYEVHTARTVQAALEEFPKSGSTVLISDVGLPDGSGCDLLRELRKRKSCRYAIAMSGYGTLSDIAASHAAGFRHHLVKPVEMQTLERLLQEASA